jgi:hypothetical protein
VSASQPFAFACLRKVVEPTFLASIPSSPQMIVIKSERTQLGTSCFSSGTSTSKSRRCKRNGARLNLQIHQGRAHKNPNQRLAELAFGLLKTKQFLLIMD